MIFEVSEGWKIIIFDVQKLRRRLRTRYACLDRRKSLKNDFGAKQIVRGHRPENRRRTSSLLWEAWGPWGRGVNIPIYQQDVTADLTRRGPKARRISTYIHTYIHTHIHTYVHTYTHLYATSSSSSSSAYLLQRNATVSGLRYMG